MSVANLAIQPKELEEKKKVDAKPFLDALEKEIDKQLISKPYNSSMMIVDINSSDYQRLEDKNVFEALEKRYHGWLVRKVYTGQRDDSYQLTFIDKKKIPTPGLEEDYNTWGR